MAVLGGRTPTLQDWRRAMVMQEILSPPLALRSDRAGRFTS
jgi:hypothetical protein